MIQGQRRSYNGRLKLILCGLSHGTIVSDLNDHKIILAVWSLYGS